MTQVVGREIDSEEIIDRRLSAYQFFVIALCAMVVFLDGIDTQVIGVAAPAIGHDLGIDRALLGPVFSAGTFGAVLGALSFGVLADRHGRKTMLLAATVWFASFTLATAFAWDIWSVLFGRFATGIGLGGAVPCFVALGSEYIPARRRAPIIGLLWAAFPLGGALGALLNGCIAQAYGWRALFVVWGAAPLGVALLHALLLPESLKFLIKQNAPTTRIAQILNRIEPGSADADSRFRYASPVRESGSVRELFGETLRVPSWSLASIAFIIFGLLVVTASWTPALLVPYGYTLGAGAVVVAANGFGSFLGTIGAGFLLQRLGVLRVMVPAVVATMLAFMGLGLGVRSASVVQSASFASGFFLGLASSSMLGLAALSYPTHLRSTAIGWSMGMGRLGAVLLPLLVGVLVAAGLRLDLITLALSLIAATAIPVLLILARHRSVVGLGGVLEH